MMTAEFSSSACPPSEAQASRRPHAAAAGLFRLTPSTITVVKEEEICVFTRDKCTLNTALSIPAASLPTDYVEAALIRTTAAAPFSHEVLRDTESTAAYGASINNRFARVHDKVAGLC